MPDRVGVFDGYWRPLCHTPSYAQTLLQSYLKLSLTASSVFPLYHLLTIIVDINNNSSSPAIIVGLLHAMPCGGTFQTLSSVLIISSLQCRKLKLRTKKHLVQCGQSWNQNLSLLSLKHRLFLLNHIVSSGKTSLLRT